MSEEKKQNVTEKKKEQNEKNTFWGFLFGYLILILAWYLWIYYHPNSIYHGYHIFMASWGILHIFFHVFDRLVRLTEKDKDGMDVFKEIGMVFYSISTMSLVIHYIYVLFQFFG